MAHVLITTNATREQTVIGATPQSSISIGYEFFEADGSDIEVFFDTVLKIDPTDYTITPTAGTSGGFAGGTINFVVAQSSITVTTQLALPLKRSTDFPNSGAFNITTLNTELDKLWSALKQTSAELVRKVGFITTDTVTAVTDVDWPLKAARASQFAGWDSDGKFAALSALNSTPVSAFMVTVLDDLTALAARATLGLAIGTDVQADLAVPTQAEAEAGTATSERVWTAQRVKQAIDALAVTSIARGAIGGLILSNDTDTVNDINVTSGAATTADHLSTMTLGTEQTKQIDVSWATGNDAGGLSSSLTLTNDTWYHIHLFTVGSTVEVGFDTSTTAINLIADHGGASGKYRRLGSILYGTATIEQFTQNGEEFWWDDPPLDVSDSTFTNTASTLTLSTPLGVEILTRMNIMAKEDSGAAAHAYISPLSALDEAPSSTLAPLGNAPANGTNAYNNEQMEIMTNTSSQIRARGSAVNMSLFVVTTSWTDRRGRDA